MLRPCSAKRLPKSKPAEYIVTSPAPHSSRVKKASGASKPMKIGATRCHGRRPVEDARVTAAPRRPRRATRSARRAAEQRRPPGAAEHASAAPRRPAPARRGRCGRRRLLALLDGGDVLVGRVALRQPVVEDAARDRRRGLRAEAGVLDHQRERDLRIVGRRVGDEERVVAQVLGDLRGAVFLVLPSGRRPAPCRSCRRRRTRRRGRPPPRCLPCSRRPSRCWITARCSGLIGTGGSGSRRHLAPLAAGDLDHLAHQVRPEALAA